MTFGRRRTARLLTGALVTCAMFSGCQGGVPPAAPSPPDPRLQGRILSAGQISASLRVVDLSTRDAVDLELPEAISGVLGGRWVDGERAVVFIRFRDGSQQLFEVADGAEARPVGPRIEKRSFGGVIDLRRGTFLATTCDDAPKIQLLDLDDPQAWRTLPGGCLASLSPDGTRVAYSPDFRSLWEVPADGSVAARQLFQLEDLADLNEGDLAVAQVTGRVLWTPEGIAFAVSADHRLAAVVVTPEGSVRSVLVGGDVRLGFRVEMAWHPEGGPLALSSFSQTESALRVVDPGASKPRLLALDELPLAAPLWSPAGDAVVALSGDAWLFVGEDGAWLDRIPMGTDLPLDWTD